MGKRPGPRKGSMQFWPRKRAKRQYPLVRSWATAKDAVALGFAGYKVGMTHISYVDEVKTSVTKGMEVSVPVTIVECPPLKVYGARAYKHNVYSTDIVAQTTTAPDKELLRRTTSHPSDKQKVSQISAIDPAKVDYVMLVVYTQPKEVMIGKKKPELFEVAIGGTVADQLKYATAKMGKEIPVTEVFSTGSIVDIHAVTTGRGLQGSVKRFGVAIRAHKSEKTKRGVGSTAGGWSAQQHTMYRVAKAGQTGYHTRTEYNKKIMLIDSDATKVNPKGGFIRYGEVKNTYVLIKGSVAGPEKRMIRFNKAIRVANMKTEVPKIEYISVESKQN